MNAATETHSLPAVLGGGVKGDAEREDSTARLARAYGPHATEHGNPLIRRVFDAWVGVKSSPIR